MYISALPVCIVFNFCRFYYRLLYRNHCLTYNKSMLDMAIPRRSTLPMEMWKGHCREGRKEASDRDALL